MDANLILSTEQWNNCLQFLNRFVQKRHLFKVMDKWGIKNKTKLEEMHIEILSSIQFNIISLDDFRLWLSKHQIDGNNHHFVYDIDFQNVSEETLQGIIDTIDEHADNLLNINAATLDRTKLIHAFKIDHKYVLSYVSPAKIYKKQLDADGITRMIPENILYPSFVEFDFLNKNVIVVLNPTSNLIDVDGREQGKYSSFSPIADLYLEVSRNLLGPFYVRKPYWLTNALFSLAEEASYHNNPEVEGKALQMQEQIKDFAQRLLDDNGITDVALIDSFASEIQDSFVSVLQEEFGVIQTDNAIEVYLQKTDQATTSIALEGKGQNLTMGIAGRIAKQSRQDSDLKILGIEVKTNPDRAYRFRIEDGSDHILIRPNNTFTDEEVVRDVLSKLHQYKE